MNELREIIRQAVKQSDLEDYHMTDKQVDAIINIVNAEKVKTMEAWETLGTLYAKRGDL